MYTDNTKFNVGLYSSSFTIIMVQPLHKKSEAINNEMYFRASLRRTVQMILVNNTRIKI